MESKPKFPVRKIKRMPFEDTLGSADENETITYCQGFADITEDGNHRLSQGFTAHPPGIQPASSLTLGRHHHPTMSRFSAAVSTAMGPRPLLNLFWELCGGYWRLNPRALYQ